jgi:hypothetical protein
VTENIKERYYAKAVCCVAAYRHQSFRIAGLARPPRAESRNEEAAGARLDANVEHGGAAPVSTVVLPI